MGVDLALLPALDRGCTAAHDIINLERRSDFWASVHDLDSVLLADGVYCYLARANDGDDRGYGLALYDDNDLPLLYVTARDMLSLAEHEGVTDNWRNRAAWAYLACLPPDWPVVLFWS